MTRVQTSKARGKFAELVDRARVNGERIMLARYGKDVAAIVPAADVARLEELEKVEDRYWLAEAMKAKREQGRIPWVKVKAELGL